ncbi:MAG: hypothetical protein WCJ35_23905 [Planctomycetota bacterium]
MFFIAGCGGTASDAGKSSPPAIKTTEPTTSGKAADAAKAAAPTAESASGSVAVLNAAQPVVKVDEAGEEGQGRLTSPLVPTASYLVVCHEGWPLLDAATNEYIGR